MSALHACACSVYLSISVCPCLPCVPKRVLPVCHALYASARIVLSVCRCLLHLYAHVHSILALSACNCSLACTAIRLQGIVDLRPSLMSPEEAWACFPGGTGLSPRALPCSWSRLCGWRLGSWRHKNPGGWCGRAWSCGGSCRRSRPPTGASCRLTRRASSGRPS